MERSVGTGKMSWITLVIFGCSFLKIILDAYGNRLDEGFVILLDNELESRQFTLDYCKISKGNGKRIYKWKRGKTQLENFCCGIMLLHPRKTGDALDFIEETSFFPIVVSGGILPDELRCARYIFRVTHEDMLSLQQEDTGKLLEGFRTYLIREIDFVCKIIESSQRSVDATEFHICDGYDRLFGLLVTIGKVYEEYLVQQISEETSKKFWNNFLSETCRRIEKISDFASGDDLQELIGDLIWTYLEQNIDVLLADADRITGEAYSALKEKRLILFDSLYYYFSTELVYEICKPLLQTMSIPELKKHMSDEGILKCNSSDYTVKKQIVTVYGTRERVRMLRIVKETVLSRDNLLLEDFFTNRWKER